MNIQRHVVQTRVSQEVLEALQTIASEEDRALSSVVRRLIEQALAREEPAQAAERSHEQHKAARERFDATDPALKRMTLEPVLVREEP